MKKFAKEFKDFITRGNVLDMAIGVIIAGAFGKITTSLVNDVLMPFISFICGARDMTALNLLVRPEELDAEGNVVKEAITLGFGSFVSTIIDFVLVALVVAHERTLTNTSVGLERSLEDDVLFVWTGDLLGAVAYLATDATRHTPLH